ncbi:MAG: hypothetical protein WKF88_05625 [Ferruginibacter sp.]
MHQEIVEYGIAAAEEYKVLSEIVNRQITEGWQPYEKIFEAMRGDQKLLHQVMVKYEKAKRQTAKSKQ